MSAGSISFDGNDLQTAYVLTQDIDEGQAKKNLSLYELAHANYSALTSVNYPSRRISITGEIVGTSIADTDARVDAFRKYFNNTDANLDIGFNGMTRRYIATASSISPTRPGGLLHAPFTVTFDCRFPFGYDTSNTTLVNQTDRTLTSYADAVSFAGTAPIQLPIYTYTLTTFTGSGTQSIQFSNSLTGQTIIVSRTWTAGDVVVIDCVNKSVKVNSVETDFSGSFTEFGSGSQTINYNDTFTTRTFTINIVHLGMYD